MRESVSALVSLVVLAATLACDQHDSAQLRAKLEARAEPARTLEQSFQRIHAQLRTLQAAPCSDLAIRSAIAKSQSRSVPFIDASALARAAKGDRLDPAQPFAHFVSKGLRERRPTRDVADEKAATDAAFDAMTLTREHDFIAAIHYDFSAPKADEHRFHGGKLKGTLGLFELRSGKLVCAAPVFAQNHEEIAAKPGQTPQQAATIDLELESRRALHETFAGMTRELNLDLG